MEQFKYLKSGNVCYHSVQNPLSSSLLSKNIKIKIYSTIILPVVVYGCETWSFTLREERRLAVFENRVPRRILGQRGTRYHGSGEKYIIWSLMIYTTRQILFG